MKKAFLVFTKSSPLFLLIGITILGIFLRIENLSLFNIYPDSYQSLIVALNIKNYHDVLGYLGPTGMVYPDFFSWTHPGYPLLINSITAITHNMTAAARTIAFLAGIFAIPLAYFFIKRVFSSSTYGLAGALLTALSFNHTIWSGFIMTETTGVFFMMLFLLSLFTADKTKSVWFNWQDILSGIFFSLAVITRYEYIVLLIPVFFLLFLTDQYTLKRIFTFLSVFLSCTILILLILFPLPSTFVVIGAQLQGILTKGYLMILGCILFIAAKYFLPQTVKKYILRYGSVGAVFLIMISLFILKDFFIHEILLIVFSFIGFPLMLTKKQTRTYGYFSLIACAGLISIYYYIDPEMERYVTHLLPFLLIPASYAFIQIWRVIESKNSLQKYIFYGVIFLLIIFQTLITISGLRYLQDPSWYQTSYEDKTATIVKKYIPNNSYMLITSYPEPYYYSLHISTQSIADTYPYMFIENVKENQPIMIIEDMGMHNDFPHFTNFLNKKMSEDKVASFWVHEKFHYIDTVQKEKYPVIIYKTTLKTLMDKIKSSGR